MAIGGPTHLDLPAPRFSSEAVCLVLPILKWKSVTYLHSSISLGARHSVEDTRRRQLEHSPRTETGMCCLCTLPLVCSRIPVISQKEAATCIWFPDFCDFCPGDTLLNCLPLEAKGSLCSWSNGTITVIQNGDYTLVWHPDFYSCCQRKHLHSMGWVSVGLPVVDPTEL